MKKFIFNLIATLLMAVASSAYATDVIRIYEAQIVDYNYDTNLVVKIEVPFRRNVQIQFSDYPILGYRDCSRIDEHEGREGGVMVLACDINDFKADLIETRSYQVRMYFTYGPRIRQRNKRVSDHMTVTY